MVTVSLLRDRVVGHPFQMAFMDYKQVVTSHLGNWDDLPNVQLRFLSTQNSRGPRGHKNQWLCGVT